MVQPGPLPHVYDYDVEEQLLLYENSYEQCSHANDCGGQRLLIDAVNEAVMSGEQVLAFVDAPTIFARHAALHPDNNLPA